MAAKKKSSEKAPAPKKSVDTEPTTSPKVAKAVEKWRAKNEQETATATVQVFDKKTEEKRTDSKAFDTNAIDAQEKVVRADLEAAKRNGRLVVLVAELAVTAGSIHPATLERLEFAGVVKLLLDTKPTQNALNVYVTQRGFVSRVQLV